MYNTTDDYELRELKKLMSQKKLMGFYNKLEIIAKNTIFSDGEKLAYSIGLEIGAEQRTELLRGVMNAFPLLGRNSQSVARLHVAALMNAGVSVQTTASNGCRTILSLAIRGSDYALADMALQNGATPYDVRIDGPYFVRNTDEMITYTNSAVCDCKDIRMVRVLQQYQRSGENCIAQARWRNRDIIYKLCADTQSTCKDNDLLGYYLHHMPKETIRANGESWFAAIAALPHFCQESDKGLCDRIEMLITAGATCPVPTKAVILKQAKHKKDFLQKGDLPRNIMATFLEAEKKQNSA